MKTRILVVDDYPNLLELMSMRLTAEGYDVLTATDGMDGLQKARTQKPDLIILDVMMPKMDGFKLCRLLKFDERFKKTPVIMLTSRGSAIDRRTGKDMGADAYFLKPYDPSELMSTVRDLAGKSARTAEQAAA